MSNVGDLHSINKQFIIEPFFDLRKPLDSRGAKGTQAKVWHFVKSEVLARIVAAFMSVFAALDCAGHFSAGVVKGGLYGIRRCFQQNPSEEDLKMVKNHFSASFEAAKCTVYGSIVGVFYPSLFDEWRKD